MKPLKIGKIKLKNPLLLAPMVDVTDLPYRLICRRAGAAFAYTEMLYVDAILHTNKKTVNLMKTSDEEKEAGLQITGNDEGEFEKFAASKKWKDFDLIDLNCGCPSTRIVGSEAGSYLLQDPEKIARIIKILKKTKKAVTAKVRLGFKKNNVLEVSRAVEKAGADAITVHARLATQGGNMKADWSWIKKVKENLKIPVIGNGGIEKVEDVERMMRETNCDGVMIAGAAIGDPYFFTRALGFLAHSSRSTSVPRPPALHDELPRNASRAQLINKSLLHSPDVNRKIMNNEKIGEIDIVKNLEAFKEYLMLEKKYFGEQVDLGRVKYLGGKFLRGFDGAAKRREELMRLKTMDEVERFADEL